MGNVKFHVNIHWFCTFWLLFSTFTHRTHPELDFHSFERLSGEKFGFEDFFVIQQGEKLKIQLSRRLYLIFVELEI
jgi:hypothetical protein